VVGEMKTWKVFDIVGSLHVGITLFSIFIYVYVKQSVEEFLPSEGSVEVLSLELVAERSLGGGEVHVRGRRFVGHYAAIS
jgi:hypothetical protein